eukprot:403356306
MLFWPRNKITGGSQTEDQSIENFHLILCGLEKYYQSKLDSIINSHTANIDVENLVLNKDQNALNDIIELIMGAVINCEDKQDYIQRMFDFDEKTQEDLKIVIEKALQRLSVEMTEASQASDSTAHLEMQQTIERLERERKLLREKSLEVENENRIIKQELKEKSLMLKQLEQNVQQLSYEKELIDQRGSKQDIDFSGLKGIGELEAQLNFKEKECSDLKQQLDQQKNDFKKQLKEYREEIQMQKERLMKQQKSDAQMEVYKQKIDEASEMTQKLSEYETANQKMSMQIKTLEHELKQSESYKSAIDFLKEELRKTKQDYTMEKLEHEKIRVTSKEYQDKLAKLEKKFANIEQKYQSTLENLEIMQSKLSVYEENPSFSKMGRNELSNYDQMPDEDLQEKIAELEKTIRDVENENKILRINNESELNTQVLILEQKNLDLHQDIEKFKNQLELRNQKVHLLEEEIDGLRNKVEQDYEQRDQKLDLNKEILRLKYEKDQQKEKLEKLIKKLDSKKVLELDIKNVKEEKSKLDDEIRKLYAEKSEDKEQSFQLKEEKIRLQSQVRDLELKLNALQKDNETLDKNMQNLQLENSQAKSTSSTEQSASAQELQNKLSFLSMQVERDQLKWEKEKQEMHNKIQEYEKLHKSKENEFKIREEQLKQKLKDEIRSIEDSYKEESDRLNEIVREKQLDAMNLKAKYEESDRDHYRTNAYLSSSFYNLGLEHIKSQRDGTIQPMSWLDKQRSRAYGTAFESVYNPY